MAEPMTQQFETSANWGIVRAWQVKGIAATTSSIEARRIVCCTVAAAEV